ncbi:hypothetical protein [Couchioplanes caeruleus]|uniref:Uncharacterized protein n=1 Tax=Couchioplanes caeruleus subsp. caeruleus TaxID=56427 RepID=A0A1K0FNZ5_9ACTN|nr:hypothetical protein [Couchioplanes caeruleus]OJF14513.1 hypothetical protein BG844_09265 [Couchioplanes caeruleus subsp. caeruleus]
MADPVPHHLVAEREFADERFWSAAARLAGRLGHRDHSLQLVGEVERLAHYALRCVSCDRPIATFEVQVVASPV